MEQLKHQLSETDAGLLDLKQQQADIYRQLKMARKQLLKMVILYHVMWSCNVCKVVSYQVAIHSAFGYIVSAVYVILHWVHVYTVCV